MLQELFLAEGGVGIPGNIFGALLCFSDDSSRVTGRLCKEDLCLFADLTGLRTSLLALIGAFLTSSGQQGLGLRFQTLRAFECLGDALLAVFLGKESLVVTSQGIPVRSWPGANFDQSKITEVSWIF